MKKRIVFLLIVTALLCVAACASAYQLKLPAGVKTIEASAFENDKSLDVVILPDGLERIESRAFAGSGVLTVRIPASVTYIAPDAFDGIECLNVEVEEGTWAAEWWASVRDNFISKPEIVIQPSPQEVPNGETVTFTVAAENADSIRWQVDRGDDKGFVDLKENTNWHNVKTDTLTFTAIAAREPYIFRAVAANRAGETPSDPVQFAILYPPEIVTQPVPQEVPNGETVTFTVAAENADSIRWQVDRGDDKGFVDLKENTNWHNVKTDTLTFTAIAAREPYIFRAVAANRAGETPSDPVQFAILYPPEIVTQPVPQEVPNGETVTFTVAAKNADSIRWQVDRGDEKGFVDLKESSVWHNVHTDTLSFTAIAARELYAFRAVAKNRAGETPSDPVQFTILYPPEIVTQPVHQEVPAGETVTFTVAAENADSIRWQVDRGDEKGFVDIKDNSAWSGTQTDTLTFKAIEARKAYKFRAVAKNRAGETPSKAVQFIILPPIDFTFEDNGDGTCTLTGYTGTGAANLVIPETLYGRQVTAIGAGAFQGQTLLTGSLTIPSGVKTIGEEAFCDDTGLERVVLPSGIERIESRAFANSSIKRINLPRSLTYIADDAFDGCDQLTNVVVSKGSYAANYAVLKRWASPTNATGQWNFFKNETDGEKFINNSVMEYNIAAGDLYIINDMITTRQMQTIYVNRTGSLSMDIIAYSLNEAPDFDSTSQINRRVGSLLWDETEENVLAVRRLTEAYVNRSLIHFTTEQMKRAPYAVVHFGVTDDAGPYWYSFGIHFYEEDPADIQAEITARQTGEGILNFSITDDGEQNHYILYENVNNQLVKKKEVNGNDPFDLTNLSAGEHLFAVQPQRKLEGKWINAGELVSIQAEVCRVENGLLLKNNGNDTFTVKGYLGDAGTLTIPAKTADGKSIVAIGEDAFKGNESIANITLSEGLEQIRSMAFANSTVERVYLPASLSVIAVNAFDNTAAIGWGPDGTYASAFFDQEPNLTFERAAIKIDGIGSAKWMLITGRKSVKEFSISASLPCTAVSDSDWLSCVINGSKLTLIAEAFVSDTYGERTGTVTVTDGHSTATVSVIQSMILKAPTLRNNYSTNPEEPTIQPLEDFRISITKPYTGSSYTRFQIFKLNRNTCGYESIYTHKYSGSANAIYHDVSIAETGLQTGEIYRFDVYQFTDSFSSLSLGSEQIYRVSFYMTFVDRILPTGLTLQADRTKVYVGETLQITPVFTPAGSSEAITYAINDDDSDIAVCDQTGRVSPLKKGDITVTATSASGLTASINLKCVRKLDSVSFENSIYTTDLTSTKELVFLVFEPEPVEITSSWKKFTFTSSNEQVATCSYDYYESSTKCIMQIKGPGVTTIKATNQYGQSASCQLHVLMPRLLAPDIDKIIRTSTKAVKIQFGEPWAVGCEGDEYSVSDIVYNIYAKLVTDAESEFLLWDTSEGSESGTEKVITIRNSKSSIMFYVEATKEGYVSSRSQIYTVMASVTEETPSSLPAPEIVSWNDYSNEARITWNVVPGITAYKVYYSENMNALNASERSFTYSSDYSQCYATIYNLTRNKTYYFAVVSIKDGKESAYSNIVAVRTGSTVYPTSIEIEEDEITLVKGTSKDLDYSVLPAGASQLVTWSSDNSNVAKVNAKGLIEAMGEGTTTITAKCVEDQTVKKSITVRVIESILPPIVDDALSLDASQWYISSANSQNKTVHVSATGTWYVSQRPDWVSVYPASGSGDADIVLTCTQNSTQSVRSDSIVIKMGQLWAGIAVTQVGQTEQPVTGIRISNSEWTMNPGDSKVLTASLIPEGTSGSGFKWGSDNKSVADVDADGTVKAYAPGDAVITVSTTDNKHSASCTFHVVQPKVDVQSITLNKKELTLTLGSHPSEKLTATVLPAAADQTITWDSGDDSIATVSQTGLVTAKAAGTVVIYAKTKDQDFVETCTVTVKEPVIPLTDFVVNRADSNLQADHLVYSMTSGDVSTNEKLVLIGDAVPGKQFVYLVESNAPYELTCSGGWLTIAANPGTYPKGSTRIVLQYGESVTNYPLTGSVKFTFQDGNEITLSVEKPEYTLLDKAFTEKATNTNPNHALANASINACAASDNGTSALDFLEDFGFKYVRGFDVASGTDTAGHFMGVKEVVDENGDVVPVFAVIIRGTNGSVKEWRSNFRIGTGDVHEGFNRATNRIIGNLTDFIADYFNGRGENIQSEKYKLWICGHSRGAACGNILAYRYTAIPRDDVYAYLYATPNVTKRGYTGEGNIKNFIYAGDLVPRMVPVPYGYSKYGITYYKYNARSINGRACTNKQDLDLLIEAIYAVFPDLSDLESGIEVFFDQMDEEADELLSTDAIESDWVRGMIEVLLKLNGVIKKDETAQRFGLKPWQKVTVKKVLALLLKEDESYIESTIESIEESINSWKDAMNAHYIDAYQTWMRNVYPPV